MTRIDGLNPEIFVWAREQAGLELAEAAKRIGFQSSVKNSAEDKLIQIESGFAAPTRVQLEKFAEVYRRPLVTFYLKQPPQISLKGEDFRGPISTLSYRENANLNALLRDIRARQELVKDVLDYEEEQQKISLVGSCKIEQGVDYFVSKISEYLGFDHLDRSLRKGGPDQLFKSLRASCEVKGIFVVLAGDLGSHHSAISVSVFRGFVISNDTAPFIVINDQDAKAARPFSLLHELAHLCMGQTGISAETSLNSLSGRTEIIERFCDDVASRFLLPEHALSAPPVNARNDVAALKNIISGIAELWAVSEPMVAYRYWRKSWIEDATAKELFKLYRDRWASNRAEQRERNRNTEGGPSFYTIKQSKLGNALISLIQRNLYDNLISPSRAAKVLGVNVGSVEPLIRHYESSLFDRRRA
ncbi:ImmA/IrrE family metallo-endopeptidase [Asticcacaulis endophyticus]|uniref:DNA-binding protein n=1 Tax=Asticcacaulis endophyticus TaxID=1395890 RepID=A0A918QF32_9CAUL|nr:XRE family transcriptional regulator [Asticcacaulis endophyticus]GGZ45403.1 DNA-binding protein [Asticcacaulis endophyticus]